MNSSNSSEKGESVEDQLARIDHEIREHRRKIEELNQDRNLLVFQLERQRAKSISMDSLPELPDELMMAELMMADDLSEPIQELIKEDVKKAMNEINPNSQHFLDLWVSKDGTVSSIKKMSPHRINAIRSKVSFLLNVKKTAYMKACSEGETVLINAFYYYWPYFNGSGKLAYKVVAEDAAEEDFKWLQSYIEAVAIEMRT